MDRYEINETGKIRKYGKESKETCIVTMLNHYKAYTKTILSRQKKNLLIHH